MQYGDGAVQCGDGAVQCGDGAGPVARVGAEEAGAGWLETKYKSKCSSALGGTTHSATACTAENTAQNGSHCHGLSVRLAARAVDTRHGTNAARGRSTRGTWRLRADAGHAGES